jgi:hypothetical protein
MAALNREVYDAVLRHIPSHIIDTEILPRVFSGLTVGFKDGVAKVDMDPRETDREFWEVESLIEVGLLDRLELRCTYATNRHSVMWLTSDEILSWFIEGIPYNRCVLAYDPRFFES